MHRLWWDCLDLEHGTVTVVRVAIEVAGTVTIKPYPKTRAGLRTVPLPSFVAAHLRGYH